MMVTLLKSFSYFKEYKKKETIADTKVMYTGPIFRNLKDAKKIFFFLCDSKLTTITICFLLKYGSL